MGLEEQIGQKLVIGIPGTRITPEIVRHFQELQAGGLILYRINFESPAQLRQLIADLEEALGRRLLVTADHEGGRVIMFREGITVFPDNLAVGTAGNRRLCPAAGRDRGQGTAPAGDGCESGAGAGCPDRGLQPEYRHPFLRAGLASWWRRWARRGLPAMQQGGLSACAKHFPGKGHAPVDAHLGLPVISSTWQEMEAVHLQPFVTGHPRRGGSGDVVSSLLSQS